MDTNIVMALISAGAALLGSVIGASATIMATILNKKMQEKGKVTLYMRHVASNSGKNWGYYQGSRGMYFRVPLWVDVINECGIPRIIRDINLYAYKEGKEVKEFTQIQRIGDGENAFKFGENEAYTLVIPERSSKRYNLEFMLRKNDINTKEQEFDQLVVMYFDEKNRKYVYNLEKINICWKVGELENGKGWIRLREPLNKK